LLWLWLWLSLWLGCLLRDVAGATGGARAPGLHTRKALAGARAFVLGRFALG
jgi:hypothetical protein